jgi:outer membrane lipoprotein-sorting protein
MPREAAREVMQRMVDAYASLTSYQDEGVVLSHWVGDPGPNQMDFKMYARKPGHFRFEFVLRHPYPPLRHIKSHRVVWSNGHSSFTYWDKSLKSPKFEKEQNLLYAVAGATGVSHNAVVTITALLLGDAVPVRSVANIDATSLLEPANFEGTPCIRIQGRDGDETVEIWIGQDDFLMRRLLRIPPPGYLDGRLKYEEEIRRSIKVNEPIDESVFDFVPPP